MDITVLFEKVGDPANTFTVSAESYSWGMTHQGSGGSPQGSAVLGDFTFTAVSSPATTAAMKSACDGAVVFTTVIVRLTDTAVQPPVDHDWALADVFISAFQTGGASSQDSPVDVVSLNANFVGFLP